MDTKSTNWDLKIKLAIKETAGKINIPLLRNCLLDMAAVIAGQNKAISDLTLAVSEAHTKEVELESRIAKLEGKIAAVKKATVSE